jgi:hypothetical protein
MGEVRFTETIMNSYSITQEHIPENSAPHIYRCGNLKSSMNYIVQRVKQEVLWRTRFRSSKLLLALDSTIFFSFELLLEPWPNFCPFQY